MIRYLNLPPIPQTILDKIPRDFDLYEKKTYYPESNYVWTDSFNQELNEWACQNIGPDLWFGFQIISGDVPIHSDFGTLTKLIYLIDDGGSGVQTVFYKDHNTEEYSTIIEIGRWHLLQADKLHSVKGVIPGRTRFSATARIFP